MTSRASAARATRTRLPLDLDLGQRFDQRLGDEALGDDVGDDADSRPAPARCRGRSPRWCATGIAVCRFVTAQGASVEAGRTHRLEEQLHSVRAGEADQRVVADPADRAPHLLALDPRLDPDRRQLDHLGAEIAQRLRQAARLGAGAGDDDAAAVQGPALEPGQRLAALHHRADDDQRRGAYALALDRLGEACRGWRRRCAARPSCRARPRRRARRHRGRPRSAPPRWRRGA